MLHALVFVVLAVVAAAGTPLRTTEDDQSGPSQLPLVTLEVLKHLEELPPAQRITELGDLHNELHLVPEADLRHSSQPLEKWWASNWTFILPQTVINFYQILPNTLDRPVSATELWNYGY